MAGREARLPNTGNRCVLITNETQMLLLTTLNNNATLVHVELEIEKLKVHLFFKKCLYCLSVVTWFINLRCGTVVEALAIPGPLKKF